MRSLFLNNVKTLFLFLSDLSFLFLKKKKKNLFLLFQLPSSPPSTGEPFLFVSFFLRLFFKGEDKQVLAFSAALQSAFHSLVNRFSCFFLVGFFFEEEEEEDQELVLAFSVAFESAFHW